MSSETPNHEILPFETTLLVRNRCLCLHTQRAARAVARRFDEALRPLGLKSGQFSLLMSLNGPRPRKLGSIARFLAMDRTTLTANLKPLERDGLVERRRDDKDRRARRLALTEKGHDLLLRAVPVWRKTHRDVENVLTTADRLRADLNMLLCDDEKDLS